MRTICGFYLLLALMLVSGVKVQAQIVLPDVSPFATLTQRIGFEDVKIEYSRPGVRGRVVFGDVVPPGAYWVTHTKAQIYAKETDYNKAIETARISIEKVKLKEATIM